MRTLLALILGMLWWWSLGTYPQLTLVFTILLAGAVVAWLWLEGNRDYHFLVDPLDDDEDTW